MSILKISTSHAVPFVVHAALVASGMFFFFISKKIKNNNW